MKKLNKKGFTLIEMLVVIAIIAILVAIIIPTVTSATSKAKASTDAANLRSAKAVITIGVLDGTYDAENLPTYEDCGIPEASKLDGEDYVFHCSIEAGEGDNSTGSEIHVWYGSEDDFGADSHGINYYSEKAGGETEAE